jgi:hypothetical protein
VAYQLRAGLERRVVNETALAHEAHEGAARPPRSEVAGDRSLELARGRRGTPKAERLRFAAFAHAGECARLRAFEGARLAGQRKGEKRRDIRHERQDYAADQRIGREGDERSRAQPGDRQRSVRQKAGKRLFRPDRGEQQEVEPGERAHGHAGNRSSRRPAAPVEAAEKSRRDLGHGRERQEADRHETRFAGHALVGEAERQNADDRGAADP